MTKEIKIFLENPNVDIWTHGNLIFVMDKNSHCKVHTRKDFFDCSLLDDYILNHHLSKYSGKFSIIIHEIKSSEDFSMILKRKFLNFYYDDILLYQTELFSLTDVSYQISKCITFFNQDKIAEFSFNHKLKDLRLEMKQYLKYLYSDLKQSEIFLKKSLL